MGRGLLRNAPGEMLWEQGRAESSWSFTGEWYDANAELVYLRARWYEPQVGRFLSPDPITGDFQNPQSINLYAYVWNDAINRTNPGGCYAEGPASDNVCGDRYGIPKHLWCEPAQRGSLKARENIYR